MNIQSQSALLAAFVNLLLAISVVIRWRWTPLSAYYVLLGAVLSSWTFTNFMVALTPSTRWELAGDFSAALIPLVTLKFFQTFLNDRGRLATTAASVTLAATLFFVIAIIPLHDERLFKVSLFVYVFATLYLCVFMIWKRVRADAEPSVAARLLALTIGGLVVITLSLADFVPTLKASWPALGNIPVLGNVVIMFFMFFLYQIIVEVRLLGLSELVGKIAVLAALIMIMAAIYGVLAVWIGDQPSIFGFYTLIVSFVMLILFEPMRDLIEERVNRLLFRERFEFARHMAILRREMANVVEIDDLAELIISRLRDTRRVTQASLYLLEDDATAYRQVSSVGDAPDRLDAVTDRVFFEKLAADRALVAFDFEAEIEERLRDKGQGAETSDLSHALDAMRRMGAGVSIPIMSAERVIGLLNVNDDRIREAYTPEELRSLVQIASQAAICVENSRLVATLREKDRMAALGEMAAGLAHEIRNPLGAIKGAAQLLALPDSSDPEEDSPQAFLNIIIEEVNRLNTVVSQFLDYARPYRGNPISMSVNGVVERTIPLFRQQAEQWGVVLELDLQEGLQEVRVDPDLMRHVFLNLAINAIQATGVAPEGEPDQREGAAADRGEVPTLAIRTRAVRRLIGIGGRMLPRDMIEVHFEDNGCGIPELEFSRIFIPFFTTRQKGTGLGLAISQRIVENLGGKLEFSSKEGEGTTFRVLLPLLGSGA